MNVSTIKGVVCIVGACISMTTFAARPCMNVSTSNHQDTAEVRKLRLSIGQSAASVSSDPALAGIVAAEPFEKGVAVYVNQPFELTYQQEGLTFHVPRTHTLWMTSSDKKLTDIGIELCPLFENDFGAALRVLTEWKMRFDGMGLEKIDNDPRFPVREMESLAEQFKATELPKFGQAVGLWRRGRTSVSLDLIRIKREYFNASTQAVERESYLYKVSIGLLDTERFNSIYGDPSTK